MFSMAEIIIIVSFFLFIILTRIWMGVHLLRSRVYLDLSKGLLSIIKRLEEEGNLKNIEELASETSNLYSHYMKRNPSVRKTYDSIINWLDDVMLQSNILDKKSRKVGISFDEYYETIKELQQYFENQCPYYQCNENQQRILTDIQSLRNNENEVFVNNMIERTKAEFIRQEADIKKNEAVNMASIAIGIAGILVSVLLTILQAVG